MYLILVTLQPDQPPARHAHGQARNNATQDDSEQSVSPAAARYDHRQATGGGHYQRCRQGQMAWPANVTEVAPEDWEEAEDFYAEEGQREDVSRVRKAGGKDCAGHEGCVC